MNLIMREGGEGKDGGRGDKREGGRQIGRYTGRKEREEGMKERGRTEGRN